MKHGGWFRFYNKVVDDPKVQALSGDLFKTWANLLCIASQGSGKLPTMPDMAFRLRLSIEETANRIEALKRARLIDETSGGRFIPHDWNEMQFVSDVSTERVKSFRKRHKAVSEAVSARA